MMGYVIHQLRREPLHFKAHSVFGAVSVMLTSCYFSVVICSLKFSLPPSSPVQPQRWGQWGGGGSLAAQWLPFILGVENWRVENAFSFFFLPPHRSWSRALCGSLLPLLQWRERATNWREETSGKYNSGCMPKKMVWIDSSLNMEFKESGLNLRTLWQIGSVGLCFG